LDHPSATRTAIPRAARLDALAESGLLLRPDPELDRMARLSASAVDAPTALVSLVTEEGVVFAGRAGRSGPWSRARELPLDHTFCREVVERDAPLVVEDARTDACLAASAAVRELGLVAYAGVPVRASEGHALGALCVIDTAPRAWTAREMELLADAAVLAGHRIAKRRAAIRARRWSEAVSHGLVEGAPVGIVVMGPDGTVEMANRAFAHLVGAPVAASVQDAPISAWVAGDHRDRLREALARVAAGQGVSRLDTVLLHAGGEPIEVEVVVGPLAGAGARLQMFVRDARERLRARRALDRSVALLQSTLEASGDGVLAMDHRGSVLASNRAFSTLWGIPDPRALEGDRAALREVWSALCAPEAFEAVVDGLLRSPESERREELAFRDGRTVEMESVPFRLGGETQGRVWTFRDITERRREEEIRAELEGRIRMAAMEWTRTFDTLDAPFLLLDGDGRIARLNVAALARLGAPAYADVLGRPLAEVDAGEPWSAAARAAAETARTGAPASTRLRDPSGRTWDIVTSRFERGDPPAPMVILLVRDVTEPARSDQMQALGSLLAGVAHEVRNPLFGISSTLDAMEVCLEDGGVRRFSDVLRTQVARLGALMQDLLDYGRPAEYTLRPGPADPVVRAAAAHCDPLAAASGVRVVAELEPELPPVSLDRTRLEQALENVIDNAIRHSPRGGTVRVRTAARDGELRCDVEDEGPGFGAAELAHVFDPFFTRRRGGTGLGLSLVQRIVHEHGGTVCASNRPEGGARIRISLPLAGR
jgi:PAS domain S-box-containing protein